MTFGPTFNLLSQSSPINVSEDQTDRAFKGLQRAVTFTEPTQPLEFRKSVKRRPRRKNLKTSRLLRKMGSDYKKEWMSIDEPVNVDETKVCMHSNLFTFTQLLLYNFKDITKFFRSIILISHCFDYFRLK